MTVNSLNQVRPTQSLRGHVDVLIVGAGISGLGMGHYLATMQPGKSFAIVDSRDAIGGTWDLFRYPGIRSDSDLHTFGYEFKPWTSDNAIADAHEILDYLHEVVDEDDLGRRIYLHHKVLKADFDSATAQWTVALERDGEHFEVTCDWLFGATGYYDYAGGHRPHFEGEEDFEGRIVHPQSWPEDLDYTGKKVVVIGSGATAVTLIPAMAGEVEHITMLQRSPSYVMPLPRKDPIANSLRKVLPAKAAYAATRRFNIGKGRFIYNLCQRHPKLARRIIRSLNVKALPEGFEVDTHFNPTYNPWDQRLCAVPDADLFRTIARGKASVVTDRIARFTKTGILLESGKTLDADIIVTATGLKLLPLGGIQVSVDGEVKNPHDSLLYKSFMISDIPNLAFAFGYTNSSWTLKVGLVCEHLCRLLAYMDRHGYTTVVPIVDDPHMDKRPMLDFSAGYVQRSVDLFPQQGSTGPWTVEMDYWADHDRLRKGSVEDPALRFSTAVGAQAVSRLARA
ncbi:FAD-containing monooxygenase EthA [Mycolicibacterium aromaticivorans JS19b1 = JCM 16368]|uniref:FAD-containing monooxygenase EthA n=1 Tax=Mycolicibacterium aromaticivorans JS19b1 = JCM 16368 TaxID=1440774 RepID=A0A064CHM9_9MYCO|nr:NAD(P)/FAD-dependent oxidoreductase [Mycolicibacterium aromaticivorans]KDE98243.1 FAD-containing monooxygenase EthA [Mycolicibacterium aromaticivorans JS19b1 = JCM 16368]